MPEKEQPVVPAPVATMLLMDTSRKVPTGGLGSPGFEGRARLPRRMKIGDVVTVTITASEAGLTLDTGTVNGVAVTAFSNTSGNNYTLVPNLPQMKIYYTLVKSVALVKSINTPVQTVYAGGKL